MTASIEKAAPLSGKQGEDESMFSFLGGPRGVAALASASALAIVASISAASAQQQQRAYNIPAQPLSTALLEFSRQSDVRVMADPAVVNGRQAPALQGTFTVSQGLDRLLAGTGLTHSLSPSGAILVAQASPTQLGAAEATPGYADAHEEIVVTGTNIRGQRPVGSQLQTFDSEDINRSGLGSTQDFVLSLPSNSGSGVTEYDGGGVAGLGGDRTGGGGVNLRGLGNDSTLVLIEGRRPGAAGLFTQYTDLSLIPATAIERLEVLLDGSSAIYGSDAIGGVLNVILRDDYDGAETRVRVGVADGGGEEIRASQALGTTWASGSLMGSFEYHSREPVTGDEKDFVDPAVLPFDLTPSDRTNALFLRGRQELGSNLELGFFSLSSSRESDNTISFLAGGLITDRREAEVEQYVNSIDATFSIGNWTNVLAATFGRNQASTVTDRSINGVPSSVTNRDSENAAESFDFISSGPLLDLPAGSLQLAIGGQVRRERFAALDSDNPAAAPDLERETHAVFAEARIPLAANDVIHDASLSLAARYEDYSDFGSTLNPKVGINFEPFEGLRLRGSWGTSFRAPLFQELDETQNLSAAFDLPDLAAADFASGAIVTFGGNANLQPEEAETWTFGIDFEPLRDQRLRLGVDYFHIDFSDRIASLDGQGISFIEVFLQPAFFASVLNLSPTPQEIAAAYADTDFQFVPESDVIAILDLTTNNISSTLAEGLDFHGSMEWDSGIRVAIDATYLSQFENTLTEGVPSISAVGTVFNPPEWRVRTNFGWSNDQLDLNAFVNFVSESENNAVTPEEDIDSWTTLDVSAQLRLNDGFSLRASVINAFNEDPPFVRPRDPSFPVAYDGNNSNPLGRVIAIELEKRW